MNQITEYQPQLAVRDGHPIALSRHVAEAFSKRHDGVLRAIDRAECSPEFRARNFAAATYRDAQGKPRPAVEMTRDGFCFIAMGFTGASAARWKEAYIVAFNAMESRLTPAPAPIPATVPADQLAQARQELLETQRKLIDTQEQLLSVGRRRVKKPNKPMTSDEIAEMRRLKATGLPIGEIARRLGRNAGSVSQLTRDVVPTADLFGGAA